MGNELIDKGYISNPYLSVAANFCAALKPNGIMLILDLTDRLSEQKPYFPTKMNFELNSFFLSYDQNGNQFGDQFGTLVPKPCGELPQCHRACYMQKEFTISSPEYPLFSRYPGDSSKVCYRIICRKELRDTIIRKSDRVLDRERSYMTETALLRNLTYIKNYKNSVIWLNFQHFWTAWKVERWNPAVAGENPENFGVLRI